MPIVPAVLVALDEDRVPARDQEAGGRGARGSRRACGSRPRTRSAAPARRPRARVATADRIALARAVDGQQRSKAIDDYYHGKFALSKRTEVEGAAGKKYDELDEDLKGRFLNYQISADLFISVTPSEIRETFRRINSYTVALNPEERRHAPYQGAFKWFVYELTHKYEEWFLAMGVLTEKQLVRMADTKLISKVVHAFLNGIKTAKSPDLDKLYASKDKGFPEQQAVMTWFSEAMDVAIELQELHAGPLMKPYVFYALLLAVSQIRHPLATLADAFNPSQPFDFRRDIAITNLGVLAQALEEEEPRPDLKEFLAACASETNVDTQRKLRVAWLGRALQPTLL